MKTFKQFLYESGYNVPVVTIDKWKVDLDDPETISELNKNLSISLSRGFSNPKEAFNAAKKILSMYSVEVPQVNFHMKNEGKEELDIIQKHISGENLNGSKPKDKTDHKLSFSYKLNDGKFNAEAKVS